jgi:hypothetical protein
MKAAVVAAELGGQCIKVELYAMMAFGVIAIRPQDHVIVD